MPLPAPTADIFEALMACRRAGNPAVLAIIVAAQGSTPQKAGAKMLVTRDGQTAGTVGGGDLEARVLRAALEALREGAPRLLDLELTEAQGHLCGGRVQVYLEPVVPPPALIIIGAGHVGLALAALAGFVGFAVTLADDRQIALPPGLAAAGLVRLPDYHDPFAGLTVTGQTSIVIATRGHQHDLEALAAALRTPAGYIGLLGSVKKRAALAKALRKLGLAPADLARVRTPVGLALGAVSPEEIAVSIAAQLIAHRRNHGATDFGPAAGRRLLDPDGSA